MPLSPGLIAAFLTCPSEPHTNSLTLPKCQKLRGTESSCMQAMSAILMTDSVCTFGILLWCSRRLKRYSQRHLFQKWLDSFVKYLNLPVRVSALDTGVVEMTGSGSVCIHLPSIRCDGVRASSIPSASTYASGREFNTASTSMRIVVNSS